MAFTVSDYHDLVELLRQRPEWQEELKHLLLDDDFRALPRMVKEVAEEQFRTTDHLTRLESVVGELAEAQRRSEDRLSRLEQVVQELAGAQRNTEVRLTRIEQFVAENTKQIAELAAVSRESLRRLDRLEESNLKLVNDSAGYKGDLLELRYVNRAYSYFGRWLRGTRVVLPGHMNAETERRLAQGLSQAEFEEVLNLDLLARGQIYNPVELAGQELWLAVEISYTVDRQDIERARSRAALLRKAGLRAIPVVAGVAVTQGAGEILQTPPIVLLLNGHASGWNETVNAAD